MNSQLPEGHAMELGPMGPIGEGESLVLRVSRNCPWNRCLFCQAYKSQTFSTRNTHAIEADIGVARRIFETLQKMSWEMGFCGFVNTAVADELVRRSQGTYGIFTLELTESQQAALRTLRNVANWMTHGAKRVFLQDADALSMKPDDLLHVLQCLRSSFPSLDHVSCYARSLTCDRFTLGELREFHDAGLSWCYVGIESGCDEVLRYMKKGVTHKEHVSGCRKLLAAGIRVAAFVMPGLAGTNHRLAERHVLDTIQVLNQIRPTEVRVRSLAVQEGTPLYRKWEAGEFVPPTEDQNVEELRRLIEGIEFDCSFETLQLTNAFTLSGRLPADRQAFLNRVAAYQELPPVERARYLLCRYINEGYVDCVRAWGSYDSSLHSLILDAVRGVEEEAGDALDLADRAIFSIKTKGIP